MPNHLRWIVLAALAGACSGLGAKGPPAVLPALTSIERLGYACDSGIKDNVPSGLYQWHCDRTVNGLQTFVLVNGNDRGIAEFDIGVEATDPALVRNTFSELLVVVPPLNTAPWLEDGLAAWIGPQASRVVNGVRVTGMCDETQCIVFVSTAASPLEPLPLPSPVPLP
jgi:hypothetical protein